MNVSLVNPLQASLGFSLRRFDGRFSSLPGSKTGQQLNDQIISRRWCPYPKPVSTDNVSIVNGLYRLNGVGSFVSLGSQWGTATYIETLVMSHATDYDTSTEATQIIAGVSYVFTAVTLVDPVVTALWQDGDAVLSQDGEEIIY